MGRPKTKPASLKDGFYIDVLNKGANAGMKIRRDTEEEMIAAANEYKTHKTVTILGEHKKGKWVNQESNELAKNKRRN